MAYFDRAMIMHANLAGSKVESVPGELQHLLELGVTGWISKLNGWSP